MNQETMIIALLAAVAVLCILTVVLLVREVALERRLKTFMNGKDGASLEEEMGKIFKDARYLKEQTDQHEDALRDIRDRLSETFSRTGIVKYDAFHQMGGNLSYVLCLLNEQNDGFMLNSVHSVEGSYAYIKTVKDGQSDLELGDEEKEALKQAMQNS